VRFANPNLLNPAGTALFQAPASATPETGDVLVNQGYRENSNVNAVNEMVNLIAGMRHYEAAQRAMHALSDAVQRHTAPGGE
jgi:flagellar basal-body rod protein FlgG